MIDKIALILVIIGGINWGTIGIFGFDIVSWLFGSQSDIISRIVFALVGISAVWSISLLFRENEIIKQD